MRFGLWNAMSLNKVGSLVTVPWELSKYKLDLVGVQEVRWRSGGAIPVGEYTWRKLHNEELHDLYSSPNIIRTIKSRRMRWAEHVASMEEKRSAYRLLVRKPEGKRPLRRSRRMWVDNIKVDPI
jgi:hypothetical protein